MKRYSYLVGGMGLDWSSEDEQTQLNKYGALGWQLVNTVVRPDPKGRGCVYFYFRREIHEAYVDWPNDQAHPTAAGGNGGAQRKDSK